MNTIIARTRRLMAAQFSQAGHVCRLDLEPDLPAILANPHRIEQLIVNLLSNALGSLDTPGLEVRIHTGMRADGSALELVIEDGGRAIDAADLERLYERFSTTRGAAGGTGLGMAITNAIVRQHGGKIEVRSIPGTGTSVTVVLPAMGPREADQGPPRFLLES